MAEDFRSSGPLSLILLDYVAPLDEIDALMEAHVEWLKKGFDEGVFVVAGRKDPRTGGVILVRGKKDAVAALAESDPFVENGAARFDVVGFNASFALPELADLLA